MAFNAEEFLKGVTWEGFDKFKKPDLMALAAYLGIAVKHSVALSVTAPSLSSAVLFMK